MVKNCTENYLHKKKINKMYRKTIYIKKINKKFNYYPPSPLLSLSLLCSLKIEIK